MSSTLSSSSVCSWDERDCNNLVDDYYDGMTRPWSATPYCTALTHPLVYYAEVPPYHRKSQSHQRKPKKNCFAKAFKWYVQEHRSKPTGDIWPELSGFATWLDSKYFEYVQESEAAPQQQNSTDACQPCSDKTEPTKHRKFSRSPWRKRKQQNKMEGETRNTYKTPMGSCQIILQPKDLTRPASECCHVDPETIATYSKVTVTSIELKNSQRTVIKSQSTASINNEQAQCSNEGYENTKASYTNTPCDSNCANSPDLINLQIQKALEKMQKSKSVCEELTSCLSTQNPKVKGETHRRVPTQTQKVETVDSCSSRDVSEQRTQKKPTEALKSGIFCDVNCRPNTEFNNMQDMRSVPAQVLKMGSSYGPAVPKFQTGGTTQIPSTKAEVVACDPSCTYIPKHKPVDNRKMTKQKKETVDSCSCTHFPAAVTEKILYGPNYTHNYETRSGPKRPQKEDGFCNLNCKYITKGKAEVEIKNVSVRTVDVSCEPSRTYMPGYKTKKQVSPAKTQKEGQSCDFKSSYTAQKSFVEIQSNLKEIQKSNGSCDPRCTNYTQHVQEIRTVNAKLENTNSCDPNCTFAPKYKTGAEIQTPTLKTQKLQVNCAPTCTYKPDNKYFVDRTAIKYKEVHKTSTKTEMTEAACDPGCEYNSKPREIQKMTTNVTNVSSILTEDKTVPDTVKPQTVEIARTQSFVSKQDHIFADKIEMTVKPQISCECHPINRTASIVIEEKQVPEPKPAKLTIPCPLSIPPKMTIPCEPISREYGKTKVTTDKIDMGNQCSNYKSMPVTIQTDCEYPSETTGTFSKYVLVPENSILPINIEALCECSSQALTSTKATSVPYKCVKVKKLPSVPLQVQSCNPSTQLNPKTPNRSVSSSWGSKKVAQTADVSCQYSLDDIIVKLDAPSQYEQSNLSYDYDSLCACSKLEKPRPVCSVQTTESCITKNTGNHRMRSLSLFRTDTVQTSDHSISFNDKKGLDYAFFMKIVCADKLNDCFCDDDL